MAPETRAGAQRIQRRAAAWRALPGSVRRWDEAVFEIIAEEHSKPIDSSLPFSNYYAHSSSSSLISLFLTSRLDAEEEGELEPAKELIQPIAEKIMAKYKAKEEETPLLFFVAGEVCLSICVIKN